MLLAAVAALGLMEMAKPVAQADHVMVAAVAGRTGDFLPQAAMEMPRIPHRVETAALVTMAMAAAVPPLARTRPVSPVAMAAVHLVVL